ncbi:UNVERIFIED_CONTAM: hypothetical protein GTU68_033865 [Idotea baltica]|nr:hypothetical protein [Idotea baltica]
MQKMKKSMDLLMQILQQNIPAKTKTT